MADNFRCDKCNKDFQSKEQYDMHAREQHQGMSGGQQGSQQQRSDSPEQRQ